MPDAKASQAICREIDCDIRDRKAARQNEANETEAYSETARLSRFLKWSQFANASGHYHLHRSRLQDEVNVDSLAGKADFRHDVLLLL